MQKEMRLMLNEEIARACIFGDGRSIASEDKIKEDKVRPIISDDPFYAVPKLIGKADTVLQTMDKIIIALNDFEGSGTPTLYTNKEFLTSMKLLNFVKLIKLRVYMFSVRFFRRNLMQKATSIFW